MPPRAFGKSGREHEVYHAESGDRYWKSTFPGQAGCGPFGMYTPAGYLRRLRLSNRIFGDDVAFEGILSRREGLSIVTSQSYIQPHPERFIPTEDEIEQFLTSLSFSWDGTGFWVRDDGVKLGDAHDRNFMRTPDGSIMAIDVQPQLLPGVSFEEVRAFRGP